MRGGETITSMTVAELEEGFVHCVDGGQEKQEMGLKSVRAAETDNRLN